MARINPIETSQAPAKSQEMLGAIEKKLGFVPNILQTLAHSPGALGAYTAFGDALGASKISAKLREQIAVTVAGENGCDYCASAHTAIGSNLGIDAGELSANLRGVSSDPKTEAALTFARRITSERGWVSDDDLKAVREAGYGDAEITEIIATVSLNIFTNYFNHVAQTEIDFPVVETGAGAAA